MSPDTHNRLDVLGQLPNLSIYTQICLCFPAPDDLNPFDLSDKLMLGLSRLVASFPWVSGQIVREGACEKDSGVTRLALTDDSCVLRVRDLRYEPEAPTMAALRQAAFPIHMLDEKTVAPRNTIPGTSGEPHQSAFQVLPAQVTFIKGGVLLTFAGHHAAMDMMGQGHLMRLLNKACKNEPFTSEELQWGNMARYDVLPLLDKSANLDLVVERQLIQGPPSSYAPSPASTWANFSFDADALAEIKSRASEGMKTGFVSTDDALTSFLWQSITRARLPRLATTTTKTVTLARAVDVRKYLGIPASYPGLIQNMTYYTGSVDDVSAGPIAPIARDLRRAIAPETTTLAEDTRALATLIDGTADKSRISLTASLDLSSDLMISSWAKVDCYGLDFGLGLGKPEAVRRPRFIPFESLVYILPKAPSGEMVVSICLRDDDLARLKDDANFTVAGIHVG